jgi:hypothetical protein
MNGNACNGWRFWSIQEASTARQTPEKSQAGAKSRMPKGFKRVPNQAGVPEGQVRWFCDGCMTSFYAPAGETPVSCEKGHRFDENGELLTGEEPPEAPVS